LDWIIFFWSYARGEHLECTNIENVIKIVLKKTFVLLMPVSPQLLLKQKIRKNIKLASPWIKISLFFYIVCEPLVEIYPKKLTIKIMNFYYKRRLY